MSPSFKKLLKIQFLVSFSFSQPKKYKNKLEKVEKKKNDQKKLFQPALKINIKSVEDL